MIKNIVISGEAGQGLKTFNTIVSKLFFKLGYNVYSSKDYESRIRGGLNFMSIRISDEELTSPTTDIDILIALTEESLDFLKEQVTEDGVILYDGKDEDKVMNINASQLAKDLGNPKVANTIFIGALFKILGFKLDDIEAKATALFKDEIQAINKKAIQKGYDLLESKFDLKKLKKESTELLIDGNQAIALGALWGQVKFYSAYPMTPSTGIMTFLADKQAEGNLIVEQAEDELAAINAALGASYSGIRAMTGTSGGGLSLMNEGIGLCGVMELPLVIANVQRPGPATGMPTRTAQGDLQFVINSSQDEFPLMVIAPRDAEDAFYETVHALNLAEKYQMPIILLSDQYLADSKHNMPYFDLENNKYENYYLNDKKKSDMEDYKRYEMTDNGISPLAYGGQLTNDIVLSDSHEHDEYGHVTETIDLRNKMMEKRFKKIETLKANDVKEPLQLGTDNGDYLMICWGSTYGPAKEAYELLKADGHEVTLLSFNHVWPLPQEKLKKLVKGKQLINIEGNYTAQFNKLIQQETCITVDHNILQYDGRPFTGKALYERVINEVISNE